jgi:hypothetical protein
MNIDEEKAVIADVISAEIIHPHRVPKYLNEKPLWVQDSTVIFHSPFHSILINII